MQTEQVSYQGLKDRLGRDPHAKKTVVLFDAQHAAYRAFYTRQLSTSDGVSTSVLHGLVDMTATMLEAVGTHRFLLCWDGPCGNTYRRKLYPNYKARHFRDRNEQEQAEYVERLESIKVARAGLSYLGFPQVMCEGVDGDDIVGIIAVYLARLEKINRVIIVSDDKDYMQLINDKIHVYRAIQDDYVDRDKFFDRHGFEPGLYVDWKALVGESAMGDNIPGVHGVGEKTATNLISLHGGLEAVIAHCDSVKMNPKARKFEREIFNQRENARLSYKLSRIFRGRDDLSAGGVDASDVMKSVASACLSAVRVPRQIALKKVVDFRVKYEFGTSLTTERLVKSFGYEVT